MTPETKTSFAFLRDVYLWQIAHTKLHIFLFRAGCHSFNFKYAQWNYERM